MIYCGLQLQSESMWLVSEALEHEEQGLEEISERQDDAASEAAASMASGGFHLCSYFLLSWIQDSLMLMVKLAAAKS